MENEKCRSCLYYCTRTKTCDYILIVGESRKCSVKDCDKYVLNRSAQILSDYLAGKRSLPPTDKLMLELYERGHSDVEIGRVTGKGMLIVAHWRKKMGLPSQKEIAESCHED